MFSKLSSLEGKAVTHLSHNDMDGFAPQVVSKFSSVNTVEYIHCGYNNFEEKLVEAIVFFEQYEVLNEYGILITDIAPKTDSIVLRLQKLYENGLGVVLLDHHDTNKWIAELYPQWAFIESEIAGRKTCGTELHYMYLKEKELLPPHMADSAFFASFVEQVRAYDTWDWKELGNVEAKSLNSLLYVFGPTQFMDDQIRKISDNFNNAGAVQYIFDGKEQIFVDVENAREESYIRGRAKNLFERDWTVAGKEYKVGVVYADQYHSTLGNDLHELNPHLDFVALVDMNGSKVSLRTTSKDLHVGEIARSIEANGGGHPQAAGFSIERAMVLNLVEELIAVKEPVVAAKKSWTSRMLGK